MNQHLADHYWPNQDPLGKRFRLESANNAWVEIVGIAKTSKYIFVAEPPSDFVYLPYRQNPSPGMFLVARSSGDPAALAAPLREVVRGLDVNMPIFNVRTMEELYRMRAVSIFNVLVTTVGAMGLMGLGLSIVGLYGLVAYAASRRTREIGIRMAIGATAPNVLRMVLRQGLVLALIGLVLGLAASVGAGESAERGVSNRRRSARFHLVGAGRSGRVHRDAAGGLHSRAPRRAGQSGRGAPLRVAARRLETLSKKVFRGSLRHHRGQRNLPFPRISHRRDDPVDGFL